MNIQEKNATDAWRKAVNLILDKGVLFKDQQGRDCKELLNLTISIQDVRHGVANPISRLQHFSEWSYPSEEEIERAIFSKTNLGAELYGPRMFNFGLRLNQIDDYIIPMLKNSPNTRRGIVAVYNPLDDSREGNSMAPSLIYLWFRIKDNKLHVTGHLRSNDIFVGWPANVYQLHVLQKYVAKAVSCELGSITTISNSAHVFPEYLDKIKKALK